MSDRPSAPQPVALELADLIASRYGNDLNDEAAAELRRLHAENVSLQAALDAAVAAARAEERERFVALCERAVRDFVNPGSELPYDHGFVSACNVLKQAAIRAATPQEPT